MTAFLVAFDFMRTVIEAGSRLRPNNDKIIGEMIKSYEAELGEKVTGPIKKKVERTNPEEFEIITGYGPITRGAKLDAEYIDRKRWGELDEGVDGKIENYKDILYFKELGKRFSEPTRNVLDLDRGIFSLFTIDGLTYQLKFTFNPSPRSVRRYKSTI